MASFNDFWTKTQERWGEAQTAALDHARKLKEQADEVSQQLNDQLKSDEVHNMLEAHGINALLGRAPTPGDPNWSKAVAQLDMTYVTERVVAMAMPYDRRAEMVAQAQEAVGGQVAKKSTHIKPGNNIDVIAALLNHRHRGHYMVWNVSEETYDYAKFKDQVLEFKFPGHPAPPLGSLFKICTSIENWLGADSMNVAVMHCLTGKGRTATILACVLCWVGEFSSVMEALQFIASKRGDHVEKLTIPSQRRYLQYFSNMLDGVKPRSEPLVLRRVIMNTVPRFGTQLGDGHVTAPDELGCCPYIQLFKGGKLIFTTSWTSGDTVPEAKKRVAEADAHKPHREVVSWAFPSEATLAFSADVVLHGDVLLRCRHITAKGVRISMFRAAFHTGYVPCGVLRLNKAQLDGACADSRFDDDFFLDLIFAPVVKSGGADSQPRSPGADSENAAAHRRERGLVVEPNAVSAYDAMLHRDARFWDEVSARKERAEKRRASRPQPGAIATTGHFSIGETAAEDSSDAADPTAQRGAAATVDHSLDEAAETSDLLQQLAAVGAMDESFSDDEPTARTTSTTADTSAAPPPSAFPTASASTAAPAAGSGAAPLPDAPEGFDFSDELSALAELEKELGIAPDAAPLVPTTEGSSDGAGSGGASGVVDELDDAVLQDFEGYLQQLTTDDTTPDEGAAS